MPKFTKLQKGTFVKNGKEYDYIVEIADNFPIKSEGNVRLKIIEERPAIHKVRTRYDPEITMYGDKNASMEICLGYDTKQINSSLKYMVLTLVFPFILAGFIIGFTYIDQIPKDAIPQAYAWLLLPILVLLIASLAWGYYKMNISTIADYLKANDLRKELKKDGFKQR